MGGRPFDQLVDPIDHDATVAVVVDEFEGDRLDDRIEFLGVREAARPLGRLLDIQLGPVSGEFVETAKFPRQFDGLGRIAGLCFDLRLEFLHQLGYLRASRLGLLNKPATDARNFLTVPLLQVLEEEQPLLHVLCAKMKGDALGRSQEAPTFLRRKVFDRPPAGVQRVLLAPVLQTLALEPPQSFFPAAGPRGAGGLNHQARTDCGRC